jgi:hypothetical protein
MLYIFLEFAFVLSTLFLHYTFKLSINLPVAVILITSKRNSGKRTKFSVTIPSLFPFYTLTTPEPSMLTRWSVSSVLYVGCVSGFKVIPAERSVASHIIHLHCTGTTPVLLKMTINVCQCNFLKLMWLQPANSFIYIISFLLWCVTITASSTLIKTLKEIPGLSSTKNGVYVIQHKVKQQQQQLTVISMQM